MSRVRRSKEQIFDDYLIIKKAAETAKSWSEIEKLTGLSYSKIMSTLRFHPDEAQEVYALLQKNAKTVLENLEDNEQQKDKDIAVEKTAQNFAEYITSKLENTVFDELQPRKKYVIDTSICEFEKLDELLFRILYLRAPIVVPSIVNDELEKLSHGNDEVAYKARVVMRWVASMPEIFKPVYVQQEEHEIPDESIIRYCKEHEKNIVLLTSDKHMAIDARAKGVKSIYILKSFKQDFKNILKRINKTETEAENANKEEKVTTKEINIIEDKTPNDEVPKIELPAIQKLSKMPKCTLPFGYFKGGVLTIKKETFKRRTPLIGVRYFDKLYWKGPTQLSEGMEVFIVKRENLKLVFECYLITTISFQDNCVKVFSDTIDPHLDFDDEIYNEVKKVAIQRFNL